MHENLITCIALSVRAYEERQDYVQARSSRDFKKKHFFRPKNAQKKVLVTLKKIHKLPKILSRNPRLFHCRR